MANKQKKYIVSEEMKRYLHGSEGFKDTAYRDGGGVLTIGHGLTRYADGSPIKEGDKITREQDDFHFQKIALENLQPTINRLNRKGIDFFSLPQGHQDFFLDAAFNMGTKANKKLVEDYATGDYGMMLANNRKNVYGKNGKEQRGLHYRRLASERLFYGLGYEPTDYNTPIEVQRARLNEQLQQLHHNTPRQFIEKPNPEEILRNQQALDRVIAQAYMENYPNNPEYAQQALGIQRVQPNNVFSSGVLNYLGNIPQQIIPFINNSALQRGQ